MVQRVNEQERCYIGIASREMGRVHFFNGTELEPIERSLDNAASFAERKDRTGLAILRDYFERTESPNSADVLYRSFTDQFLSMLQEREILFIEEFRIQDWLRVMHMLGEAL